MSDPLVSVVMATYNRAKLLKRSLDSLVNQTYTNIEIIVVNDASTDNTSDVLAEYVAKYSFIKSIDSATNLGPSAARNLGVQHTSGPYIAFMDDDDYCVDTRLEKQLRLLQDNPDVGLCFCLVQWVDLDGQGSTVFPAALQKGIFPDDPQEIFTFLLLEGNKISTQMIMVRRDVMLSHPFPEEIHIGEDWYVVLSIVRDGIKIQGIPEVLIYVTRSEDHVSLVAQKSEFFAQLRDTLGRIAEDFNVPPSIYRKALSNQYALEARFWGRSKGLHMLLKSLLENPANPRAYQALKFILYDRFINEVRNSFSS
jgi:glycosyltransferase involved in cell wall biosynthesis